MTENQDKHSDTVTKCETILPESDIYEFSHSYSVLVNMPGIEIGNVDYEIDGSTLTVFGSVEKEEISDQRLLYGEYKITNYRRRFILAGNIDKDGISAEYTNGVLTLTIPKMTGA